MKSIFNNKLCKGLYIAALAVASTLTSCDKEPVKAENEILNKLHEDPHKVIYKLTEYNIPEGKNFVNADRASFTKVGETTELTFKIQPDGTWAWEGDKDEFTVKTVADDPHAIYKLDIEYFNPQGAPMNQQFIVNGQDKIHQHIFSTYRNKRVVRKEAEIHYLYLYADKDNQGQYLSDNNPIGLEGFFQFKQEFSAQNIKAELIHAYGSKYSQQDGQPSTYYAQSLGVSGTKDISTDISFRRIGNTDIIHEDHTHPAGTEHKDEETSSTGGINTTEVHKITFFLGEGHFHGSSFHYIQGPQDLKKKELAVEYQMEATWQDGKWVLSGQVDKFLLQTGKLQSGGNYPAPSMGMWIELYDKENKLLNATFAESGKHQFFFRPTDIKTLSTQEPSTIVDKDVLTYVGQDTNPWDKSIAKDKATNVSATNPIGLKGFIYTDKSDLQFTWNIELWSLPQGKGTPVSPYYEPSEYARKTGKCVLRLPVPVYIWLPKGDVDQLIGEEEYPSNFTSKQKEVTEAILKVLGISFKDLAADLETRFDGEWADEKTGVGRWF